MKRTLVIVGLCVGLSALAQPSLPLPVVKTKVINTNPPPRLLLGNRALRNLTRKTGETASFTVVATSPTKSKLAYKWSYNGKEIVGATKSTLTVTNVQPSSVGTYSVQVSTVPLTKLIAPRLVEVSAPVAESITMAATFFTLTTIDTNILSECLTPTNVVLFTMCPVTGAGFYRIHWGSGATTNWTPSIWNTNFPCAPPVNVGSNWFRAYTTNTPIGTNIVGGVSNLVSGTTYFFAATATATNGLESMYSNELKYEPPFPKLSTQMSLLLLTDGTPQVTTKICPHTPYKVLWTTNLTTWTTLVVTNADAWGNVIVSDDDPSRGNMRFYRLQL